MKRFSFFMIVLFICVSTKIIGQCNLIRNGSFEERDPNADPKYPNWSSQVKYLRYWEDRENNANHSPD
ncbi:MAG: hypothetical protein H0V01_10425 [Bacteroidetes bacterium]|nr:hypothetical protein [Bacteroidota bacterium]HET6245073.1 hypothetical protein [Bacteroidia bacterium]